MPDITQDSRWHLLRSLSAVNDVDFTDPANAVAAAALPWKGIPKQRPGSKEETEYVALCVTAENASGVILARGTMTFSIILLERVAHTHQSSVDRREFVMDGAAITTNVTLNRKILLTARAIDQFCIAIGSMANIPATTSLLRIWYRIE